MLLLYTDTVTILRSPTITDAFGNEVPDPGGATSTVVSGVNVQPVSASEQLGDVDLTTTTYRLSTPRGMDLDLLATNTVEYAGQTWQVLGDPQRWPAPGGGVHHVEAILQLLSG